MDNIKISVKLFFRGENSAICKSFLDIEQKALR